MITDEEICKFIKLYRYYHPNENGKYFFKEKQLWIWNIGFVGPYLKEKGDPKYFWMNEYNGSGLWFWPIFSLVLRLLFEFLSRKRIIR